MKILIDDQKLIGRTQPLPGGNSPKFGLTVYNRGEAAALSGAFGGEIAQGKPGHDWNQGLGQYAEYPGMSPKYHTGADQIAATARQAKLFLQINPKVATAIQQLYDDDPSILNVLGKCGYVDFILTNAVEEFEEKMQLVTLTGDNYVAYYFGRKPPIFSYSGMVYNTWQDDWRIQLLTLYDRLLRGSKVAQLRTVVKLYYDTIVVIGSIPNLRLELNSQSQLGAMFSFSFLVKEYIVIQKPINAPYLLPEDACYPSLAESQVVPEPEKRTTQTVYVKPPIKKKKSKKKKQFKDTCVKEQRATVCKTTVTGGAPGDVTKSPSNLNLYEKGKGFLTSLSPF